MGATWCHSQGWAKHAVRFMRGTHNFLRFGKMHDQPWNSDSQDNSTKMHDQLWNSDSQDNNTLDIESVI